MQFTEFAQLVDAQEMASMKEDIVYGDIPEEFKGWTLDLTLSFIVCLPPSLPLFSSPLPSSLFLPPPLPSLPSSPFPSSPPLPP